MELISRADVVLALGTRLNPFSTLPGYGIDYWPTEAAIIQVEMNPDRIGLTKKVTVGDLRRREEGGAAAPRPGSPPPRAMPAATSARRRFTAPGPRGSRGPGRHGPRRGRSGYHLERGRACARAGPDVGADGVARHSGRPAEGCRHLLRHRQQLRDRQRLSHVRAGGGSTLRRASSVLAATASRSSWGPRSAARTCRWSDSRVMGRSASR